MFKSLIERDICLLIAKLIGAIFIKQQVRVKWGSHFSKPFLTSNGVKQGGVSSPVLFTLNIDKWLNRLRQSKLGCYVGYIFMALNKLINVCVSFAREYHVLLII